MDRWINLADTAYGFIGALMQRKEIAYAFTTFNTGNPQYMLNINEARQNNWVFPSVNCCKPCRYIMEAVLLPILTGLENITG